MKAVVIEQPLDVRYVDVQTPEPGREDVLVRSRVAGVCRTDLEIAAGQLTDPRWVRFPVVPGHEWSGTVTAVGDDVAAVRPGDRVVCEGMIPCNRCRRCKAGETQICENYDQLGFTRGGGYGEYVVVPQHVVHRLPDGVSFESGVLVEPASCVLRGLERGRPSPGETVGVIGIGTLGSLAVTLARLFAPGALLAYGIREEELRFAERLGAGRAIHVAEQDPVAVTHEHTGGGLDLVIETAGAVDAVELATRLVRPGGRVVLLGIAGEGHMLRLPADRIMFGDMDVIGSCSYTTAVWARVVRLLEEGLVDFAPLVTHRFPAARFEDAFRLLDEREGVVAKVLLEHPQPA
ncbi:MAG TPA: alcohol dehydrogenase catalytic domain-containing protein [Gaiellaceae bacterium]|nr:alcohol dehydrogenase catalytic domain-containing protein [Gaiellaceae bacterium]